MTPLDLITRRQYLAKRELALAAAATHQYVLDGPTPTNPADRDASWTACGPAGPTRSTA